MGHDDITAVSVNAKVEISGIDDFSPTYIEVKRSIGAVGEAKIKGLGNVDKDVFRTSSDVQIWIESQGNRSKMFYGEVGRATVNEEGVYTIEAYDQMTVIHNKLVRLNTERPRYANEVARSLINEATNLIVGGVQGNTNNPSELPPFSAYVAPGRAFPGGDTAEKRVYGTAKQGVSLYRVLQDLTDKLGGVMWVDRKNRLRIEPWPESNSYRVPHITKMKSGDDMVNKRKVVVKGGSPTGQLGLAASSMRTRFTPRAEARLKDNNKKNDPKPPEKTLEDKNVTTQQGTNKLAMNELFNIGMKQNNGKITVVGNPAVELFDSITLPELEEQIPNAENIPPATVELLKDPNYSVEGVTHVINVNDGYLTTIHLRPEPTDVLEQFTGGPVGALADEFKEKIEKQKQEKGILGLEPGFISL